LSSGTAEPAKYVLCGLDLTAFGVRGSALELVELSVVELERLLVAASEDDDLSTFG